MKKRNMIGVGVVTIGLSFAFAVPNPATPDLSTYRNAKNEICEKLNGKVHCLSERAYQKDQVIKERRAGSHREYLHDRVD